MKKLLPALFLLFVSAAVSAQAPNISYPASQVYIVGKSTVNLVPSNSGGAVPASTYGQVTTIAGNGTKGAANGAAAMASFAEPYGLARNSQGDIFVADYFNNIIRKITSTGTVSTFVPAGAGLKAPTGVAIDASDNLYIADAGNNQIKKVTPAGVVSLYAGTGDYGFAIGAALSSSFKYPAGVAVDAAGNVYVSDYGNQQIRKISTSGMVSVLAGTGASGYVDGPQGVARFRNPFGIVVDNAGIIYVTEVNNHTIRKVTPTGVVSTVAGNGTAGFVDATGVSAKFKNPYGLSLQSNGNLYVTDSGNGLIRKISPSGEVTTIAGVYDIFSSIDGLGRNATFGFPVGVVTDGSSAIYVADNGTSKIRKVVTEGYAINPALPAGLNFNNATGVISGTPTEVSAAQNYIISASNNAGNSVITINIATRLISTDATLSALTSNTGVLSPVFVPALSKYVVNVPDNKTSIAITPTANDVNAAIVVNGSAINSGATSGAVALNTGSNTIDITVTAEDGITVLNYQVFVNRARAAVEPPKIAYGGPKVYTVGSTITPLVPSNTGGTVPANSFAGVSTLANGFNHPTAVAVDGSGNVFVSDFDNKIIKKVNPAGVVSTFAGTQNGFNAVWGLATDAQGNVYVADSQNNYIRKITSAGVVSIFAGSGDFNAVNGAAADAGFAFPSGITVDKNGDFYVADAGNNLIRKISLNGEVTLVAGTGAVGGQNGAALVSTFNNPFGVATDAAGNIYIADRFSHTIRIIGKDGVVKTFAGSGAIGSLNLNGVAASFSTPHGVTVDQLGNVYVADSYNSMIRKITPNGDVTLLTGNGNYAYSDGVGENATFSLPFGITCDAAGHLYVADYLNNAVRKIELTGYEINPVLPAGLVFDGKTGTISGTPTAKTSAKTYTITAYNLGGSSVAQVNLAVGAITPNANLTALAPGNGALSPVFNSNTIAYTMALGNAVTSLTLRPTVAETGATVTINGLAVTSGSLSAPIPLALGPNVIDVVVAATDGIATKTYTVVVTRAALAIADLAGLTMSAGTLSPAFVTAGVTYIATVPNNVSTIKLTPVTTSSTATVTVNGTAVPSGTASPAVNLAAGSNIIKVVVTAQNGVTIKTYTVTVTRTFSSNADLSTLTLSEGDVSPAFSSLTNDYTVAVGSLINSITVTPANTDITSTITVNGNVVAGGAASQAIPLSFGANIITVKVTAQDGTTVKTYTITATRAVPNADLADLVPNVGSLSPAFTAGTTNYGISVGNSTTSINFTPTVSDITSVVKVNGTTVASGAASAAIALNVGANPIAVLVSAEDGITTKTYTVNVTRAASTNADLSALTVSAGSLSPAFSTSTFGYTLAVGTLINSIKITPANTDITSTITVNGNVVAGGSASQAIPLALGANVITVKVTAQDGTTVKTYTINATRAVPNADLADLLPSAGSLTPGFASGTASYDISVSNNNKSINLTPTVSDITSVVTVNGTTVVSGTASGAIALNVGANPITVLVTAEDGTTTKTYTVNVTRVASSNTDLSALTVNAGSLSPAFSTFTTGYTISVGTLTNSLSVTAVNADVNSTITVNGNAVASGVASSAVPLAFGSNVITVKVTAQDGTTIKIYTISATRAQPNADLAGLVPSVGSFNPGFTEGTTTYGVSVSNSTNSISLTPTVSDVTSVVTVNGTIVTSGAASAAIALNVGANPIAVLVTAEDGTTTKTYTVNVTRAVSSNADLTNIALSAGILTPAFATGNTDYTASVSSITTGLTLIPTVSDGTAKITVNGNALASGSASGNIALNDGPNVIKTIVTAEDGTTIKTYTVTVTRASSANADLSGLMVSAGSLAPVFAPNTLAYMVPVANGITAIKLTPALSDLNASVTVNGTSVANGSASGNIALTVGDNIINVMITAVDGVTQKTYKVTVTRLPSANADLTALNLSSGSINPVFAPGNLTYAEAVSNTVTNIQLTPVASDVNATITVNGATVISGSASVNIPLSVGDNVITTVVTAQSGIIKTYIVTVTRTQSSDANLAGLTISAGTLAPGFTATTLTYSASVANAVNSFTVTPSASDATAIIKVNGNVVTSGSASASISLTVGLNVITTLVTAQDGTVKTYTINVARLPSSNADLSALGVSSGTLSPLFTAPNTAYTLTVGNAIGSLTLSPVKADAMAAIKVNGVTVTSGSASQAIPLTVGGNNLIDVLVTAEDGATKTYTLTVTRQPSANADLAGLTLSSGVLTPVFASGTTIYTANVANNVTAITLTPLLSDAKAAVTVNGIGVNSGSASADIALTIGANVITSVVTAEDGTIKTYKLTVTRAASSDATLANLIFNGGALVPPFSSSVAGYTVTVANTVNSASITPVVNHANATVKVNGVTVLSGSASGAIALNVGPNAITTTVLAEDGTTTKAYTINITRVQSSDANLAGLALSTGTLSPFFTAATTSYTALVSNGVATITLVPTQSNALSTIKVNGNSVVSGESSAGIPLVVGDNLITVEVAAQDGTIKTYTITVTRAVPVASADANLVSLLASSGSLTPGFAQNTIAYKLTVNSATASIRLTPVSRESHAIITVDGALVTSNTASNPRTLYAGDNLMFVKVTAQNGVTTKTYTVIVIREPSTDANLSALTLSSGVLSPAFSQGSYSYNAVVNNLVNSVKITPTASEASAGITVNGVAVASGTASGDIPLTVGTNVITTVVTAQDGVNTKSYTVTVTRLPSANADLAALSVSAGALNPAFTKVNTSYTVLVPNEVSAITLTPTVDETNATVEVNGNAVGSGSASNPVSLNVGTNIIKTVVTAQDGSTTQTYTVTVNRAPSADASLADISLSNGTLTPAFLSSVITYTATVANAISSITLTPTVNEPSAIVKINGVAVASGSPSGAIALTVGPNVINTVVTAQDGTTTKTYRVTVNREPSSDASLAALKLSAGALSPAISSGALYYSASVGNAVTTITFSPIVNQPDATVQVNGVTVASGAASAPIALNVGQNIINTIVTAQDGVTTKSYTATIIRLPSSNANLTDLAISSGNLSPTFSNLITGYALLVKNNVTSITLTPKVEDNTAKVVINGLVVADGTASQPINLNVGNNKITTVVTAQDGVTIRTFTITVNRAQSSDNDLSDLILSSGTLTPGFQSGIDNYTATVSNGVSNITLTPIIADANASVKINGVTVASGAASGQVNLQVGSNTITAVVTAQNGETNTYKVVVNRGPGTNANLSNLALSNGTLTPAFAALNPNYNASVGNEVTGISLTATLSDATASVKVNGTPVATGTPSGNIPLNVGPNVITATVTAQDGATTQTYNVTITRAKSPDATLAGLTTSAGAVSPAFTALNTTYVLTVENAITSITITPTKSNANAVITVNGKIVASGSASSPVTLAVGSGNVINVLVNGEDGTTGNYIITITRKPSGNADLAGLSLSTGALTPSFITGTVTYTANVANSVTTIRLTPTVSDATATVTVNNAAVVSGSASGNLPLIVGDNPIITRVTAANGTIKTYTVVVTRAASANADLAGFTISAGTLSPAFDAGTLNYSTTVGNSNAGITVTPSVSDVNATVTVNGVTVASGVTSGNIPLTVGENTITVVVTAQNGTTQTYTITATREASAIAGLSNLVLSDGVLTPGFSQANTTYKASVGHAVTGITLSPTVTDVNAVVTVNNAQVASGSASSLIGLNVGDNVITTVVTAQNGVTTKSYVVTIRRAASSNADLSNIALSPGTISQVFSPSQLTYSALVLNSVTGIRVTPTVVDATATVKVNDVVVGSGTESNTIPLMIGSNTITTLVTAEDGSTKAYVITVTREKSGNANLSSLSANPGTLNPIFSANVNEYTVEVSNATATATLTPTASDAGASITVQSQAVVSGSPSAALPLTVGDNNFSIRVKAANGDVKIYAVNIKRLRSNNADLTSIQLSSGSLSPVFATGTLNYTADVLSGVTKIRVVPVSSDGGATIKVNGKNVNSGSPSAEIALVVGENPLTVTVTAADGTPKTYNIVVTRETPPPSANADLSSLSVSEGTLSPSFNRNNTLYAVTVNSNINKINFTGITSEGNATIAINGVTVESGIASKNFILANGPNQFFVVVTAADKVTTKSYNVVVTKANFAAALPTVFTPNGDGVNDTWVLANIELYPDCTVKIFNRGGQMIFSSVGYGTPWDGTYKGQVLPPDVYYYIIDLKHNQGVRSGSITIIK